jgi:hypothetical protein
VGALISQVPLEAEIAFMPRGGIGRNDRNEERALMDLAPDLLIPGIPAAQLTLVEKHFNPGRAKRRAYPLGSLPILGGVAQKGCVFHGGSLAQVANIGRAKMSMCAR